MNNFENLGFMEKNIYKFGKILLFILNLYNINI